MSGRILLNSTLLLAITALSASAQTHATDRGSIIVAGDASLTSTKAENDDDRTTTLRLAPNLQYFIRPGLAIGGEVLLSRTSRGDASISQYGVGPRLSYYFGQGATTTDNANGEIEGKTNTFGLAVGISAFVF
ncbi:MAG: hypothetical protein WEE89_05975 [Gemmatimonadota bacterium]